MNRMIGENIASLRKKKGLTLSELAERSNISKSYLSNIERNINKNPSVHVVEKIARVLNVDVKNIIRGKAGEKPAIEKEWLELIEELKRLGIRIDELDEYKPLLEFIKWRKNRLKADGKENTATVRGENGKEK